MLLSGVIPQELLSRQMEQKTNVLKALVFLQLHSQVDNNWPPLSLREGYITLILLRISHGRMYVCPCFSIHLLLLLSTVQKTINVSGFQMGNKTTGKI